MAAPAHSEPLQWQGAADRSPSRFIAMRVGRIEKEGGGLFGIRNSPSLAGALPDARIVEGTPIGPRGGAIKLRAPNGELPSGLASGARVVLGLVDDSHIICILAPPAETADEDLEAWAKTQPCG
jgi:hypothetical protein